MFHTNIWSVAIGWTLTGNMDSKSTNLAWHYASGAANNNPNIDPRLNSLNPSPSYEAATGQIQKVEYSPHLRAGSTSTQRVANRDDLGRQAAQQTYVSASGVTHADAESLLAISSPAFSQTGSAASPANPMTAVYQSNMQGLHPQMGGPTSGAGHANINGTMQQQYSSPANFMNGQLPMNFLSSDMMIESQDVDMSMLGLDMMPWFDTYTTHDMMPSFFDPNTRANGGADGAAGGAA